MPALTRFRCCGWTLSRLFQDYGGDGDLRLDEYELMGGIPNVVETEIEQLLSQDTEERRRQLELFRKAFIPWLVTVDAENDQPVRRVADWDELPEEARPLLNDFVRRRLLVQRSKDGNEQSRGGGVVEVALESLFRQWDELEVSWWRNATTSKRRRHLSAARGSGPNTGARRVGYWKTSRSPTLRRFWRDLISRSASSVLRSSSGSLGPVKIAGTPSCAVSGL